MSRQFNEQTVAELEQICARYPDRKAALLPALRLAEREFGSIDPDAMREVGKHIGVSPATVFGVVTFYTHYRRETDGQHIIQVCSTLPCSSIIRLSCSSCSYSSMNAGRTVVSWSRRFLRRSSSCRFFLIFPSRPFSSVCSSSIMARICLSAPNPQDFVLYKK